MRCALFAIHGKVNEREPVGEGEGIGEIIDKSIMITN